MEFIKVFEDLSTAHKRNKLATRIDFGLIDPLVSTYKQDKEYILAKKARNWATDHYIGTNLIENIDSFDANHRFRMIIHQYTGNTYYCLGEEIGNLGFFSKNHTDGITFSQMEEWALKVDEVFRKADQDMLGHIFDAYIPSSKPVRRHVPVKTRLLADLEHYRSPIFGRLSSALPSEPTKPRDP